MSEKPTPFTVDPVTDAFRRMQKGEQHRVGAATKNREMVAPFSVDGFEAESPPVRAKTTPEPPGGHARVAQRKTLTFIEEGLTEAERLQKQKRRSSY